MSGAIGFTGGTLDRADPVRHDPALFAAAVADPAARLLKLSAYQPEVTDGALGWTGVGDAPGEATLVLLGLDEGRPRFAAAVPGDRAVGRSPALFAALTQLSAADMATYAAARSVLDWHARNGFCANCGTPSEPFRAGWGRRCPRCGTEHFPRVDPVIIMLAEHDGRVLLGRQPAFPAGRYSALAGFLEPGESIEEAVARELREEAGITVRDVRYVASQPWPFASSLMIACVAQAVDDELTLDQLELEDAMWVPREIVRSVLAGEPGPFLPPPPYAIAHTLLARWSA